ncbi:MAG: MMPL family transporter [Dactylosporangium sp.]|nr:MMPL family transporter [Dactylosporangium sp.]NNJ60915.1 MMPL family transporter [Dactylosporangium sp.]
MATLLYRLGRMSFRRRRTVLAIWLMLVTAVGGGYLVFGHTFDNEFTIPGSESQQAMDSLTGKLPAATGATAQIVFVAPEGRSITDPAYVAVIKQAVAAAEDKPQVGAAIDPYTAQAIAPDERTAIAQVRFTVLRPEIRDGTLDELETIADPVRDAGLRVEFGGTAYGVTSVPVSGKETAGLLIALVVLVITFGSLLAAGFPLLTAMIGVGIGLVSLMVISNVVSLSSTAPTLALMLGLAVGIDYALFIVSRHRSQLASGTPAEQSVALATATAGSAVVFAGLTVIIALCGLAVVRLPFLTVMGLGAAGTVVVAVLVAVTLLPALLGFAGDRLRPKLGSRAARQELAESTGARSGGERWVGLVTKHPQITVLAGVVLLLAVAIPAPSLRLSLPDNGGAPEDTTQRQAYDLISAAFGPGFNGPLAVVLDARDGQPAAALQQAVGVIAEDLNSTDGVLTVTQPQFSASGATAVIPLIPTTAPDSTETKDLVETLRGKSSGWERATGSEVAITGETAVQIDVSNRLADSLIPFVAVVVGLALLLLLIVFRSIVVPIKATAGFLLSIVASFGAVVAVFQWGWLADLVRIDTTGPVISFLPIIVIGVLFGLAMDYEVFVVSRIREEYVHTGDAKRSVLVGTRHASRVVTAAALIMFAVFASFIGSEDTVIKSMAFALAFGIAVDAFLVRMTLVPAVMALVGRGAWWLPGWLERLLPNLDIEGQRVPRPAAETADPTPALL